MPAKIQLTNASAAAVQSLKCEGAMQRDRIGRFVSTFGLLLKDIGRITFCARIGKFLYQRYNTDLQKTGNLNGFKTGFGDLC